MLPPKTCPVGTTSMVVRSTFDRRVEGGVGQIGYGWWPFGSTSRDSTSAPSRSRGVLCLGRVQQHCPGPVTITDVAERRFIATSDVGTLFRMGNNGFDGWR